MVTNILISNSVGNFPLSETIYFERSAFFKFVIAGDMIFLVFRLLRIDRMPAIAEWANVYTYQRW